MVTEGKRRVILVDRLHHWERWRIEEQHDSNYNTIHDDEDFDDNGHDIRSWRYQIPIKDWNNDNVLCYWPRWSGNGLDVGGPNIRQSHARHVLRAYWSVHPMDCGSRTSCSSPVLTCPHLSGCRTAISGPLTTRPETQTCCLVKLLIPASSLLLPSKYLPSPTL